MLVCGQHQPYGVAHEVIVQEQTGDPPGFTHSRDQEAGRLERQATTVRAEASRRSRWIGQAPLRYWAFLSRDKA